MTRFGGIRISVLRSVLVLTALVALIAVPASAWPGADAGAFASGFGYPFFKLHHAAAMIAVGAWSAMLPWPAVWVLLFKFPVMLAIGCALGALGGQLPFFLVGIAASLLVLGLVVVIEAQVPIVIATVMVGVFAVFHGFALGLMMPEAVSGITYACSSVLAALVLHLVGVGIGHLAFLPRGRLMTRGLRGALIAQGTLLIATAA